MSIDEKIQFEQLANAAAFVVSHKDDTTKGGAEKSAIALLEAELRRSRPFLDRKTDE